MLRGYMYRTKHRNGYCRITLLSNLSFCSQCIIAKAGGLLFILDRHVYFLGWAPQRDHPPPKPPFQCPHQTRKGTNLLLFDFYIHLHTHQDLKLNCCRFMGRNLRYGRPCTHDVPGTHNWLAHSHIASTSSEFHGLSHAGTILKFGVNCCSIGLTKIYSQSKLVLPYIK